MTFEIDDKEEDRGGNRWSQRGADALRQKLVLTKGHQPGRQRRRHTPVSAVFRIRMMILWCWGWDKMGQVLFGEEGIIATAWRRYGCWSRLPASPVF